jgi:hypothetical protein
MHLDCGYPSHVHAKNDVEPACEYRATWLSLNPPFGTFALTPSWIITAGPAAAVARLQWVIRWSPGDDLVVKVIDVPGGHEDQDEAP